MGFVICFNALLLQVKNVPTPTTETQAIVPKETPKPQPSQRHVTRNSSILYTVHYLYEKILFISMTNDPACSQARPKSGALSSLDAPVKKIN